MSSAECFYKRQGRVGHYRNDDPKELIADDLATLGRALAEEYWFTTSGMNALRKMKQIILMTVMAF